VKNSVFQLFSKRPTQDIDTIIAGCKKQEAHCQRLLFNRYAPKVLTTCRRYENHQLDAQDILQDTFITVFEKIDLYDSEKGNIENWISRIAINTALKSLRKKQPITANLDLLPDLPDEVPDNDEHTLNDWTEEEILAVIQDLPPGYRTVFNLYVIDGFSHQEIADQLEISPQTSKSQLFKAKALLRQKFAPEKKMIKIG
jgi:RNA polymerase sigma factor (sigma-70 family)